MPGGREGGVGDAGELLNEIARPLHMPYNVAAGKSSGYNYASGRLDHQAFFKAVRIDRTHRERLVLDRVFAAWLSEAVLIEGLPRFSMVAYTGDAMRVGGWRHPVVVDLEGLSIPAQRRPIRFAHSAFQGVGHTERIAVEGGRLVA